MSYIAYILYNILGHCVCSDTGLKVSIFCVVGMSFLIYTMILLVSGDDTKILPINLVHIETLGGSYWYIYNFKQNTVAFYKSRIWFFYRVDYSNIYNDQTTKDITKYIDSFVEKINGKYREKNRKKLIAEELKTYKYGK